MAVKKSKSEASKALPKKKAAGQKPDATKAKDVAPVVASDTASKAKTPKPVAAAKAPAAAKKASAPKKAVAPVKLNPRQLDFLKQIHGAKEDGYVLAKKAEQRTIEALLDRKLIKKGAKDKTSGHFRYLVSKAGEKHLSSISPA